MFLLQRRFPDLNITEEDLKDAEKELDELLKAEDEKKQKSIEKVEKVENTSDEKPTEDESKKTIQVRKQLYGIPAQKHFLLSTPM